MSLGTRPTDQVKIVPDFGLIWLIILTEKKDYFKKEKLFSYFHNISTFHSKVISSKLL